MAKIVAEKVDIYEEEVGYRSSVSEAVMVKVAKGIQYHNENSGDAIGKVEQCMLTEEQFCTLKGDSHTNTDYTTRKWVLMSGQDITGSDFANLTGITTLPNATSTSAFFRQGSSLGSYQDSQNKSHNHSITHPYAQGIGDDGENTYTVIAGLGGATGGQTTTPGTWDTSRFSMSSEGGSESRPNNYQMNFFIKINW